MRAIWTRAAAAALGLLALCGLAGEPAQGADAGRAPVEQYRMASPAEEIALARSAAPMAISAGAQVLVLGARGYEVAAKGGNGFVCLVERGWSADFEDKVFWSPRIRGPICYNPPAARSVLPAILERTQWVLAGETKAQMAARTRAEVAAGTLGAPEAGAMSYMMSRGGVLDVEGGHWHPHLMVYTPRMAPAQWGADAPGGAVIADAGSLQPMTVFFVPVPQWSDGTPGPMPGMTM
jgi:hypothetical protein